MKFAVLTFLVFTINLSGCAVLNSGSILGNVEPFMMEGDYTQALYQYEQDNGFGIGSSRAQGQKNLQIYIRYLESLDTYDGLIESGKKNLSGVGMSKSKGRYGGYDCVFIERTCIDLRTMMRRKPHFYGFSPEFMLWLDGRMRAISAGNGEILAALDEARAAKAQAKRDKVRNRRAEAEAAGYTGFHQINILRMIADIRMGTDARTYLGGIVNGGYHSMTEIIQVLPSMLLVDAPAINADSPFMVLREPGTIHMKGQNIIQGDYVFLRMHTYTTVLGSSRTVPLFKRVDL